MRIQIIREDTDQHFWATPDEQSNLLREIPTGRIHFRGQTLTVWRKQRSGEPGDAVLHVLVSLPELSDPPTRQKKKGNRR